MAGPPGAPKEIAPDKCEPVAEEGTHFMAEAPSVPAMPSYEPLISTEIAVHLSDSNDNEQPRNSPSIIASTSNFLERMWKYATKGVELKRRTTEKPNRFVEPNLKPNTSCNANGKYICAHCGFSSSDKADLRDHIVRHALKKYSCVKCKYMTSSLWSLKAHVRTHTGERPFACPHCSYRATLHQHLKSHILTHTGDKPRQCPYCSYKCRESGALKKHITTHTGERPHSCPYCDYRCSRLGHLKRHIMTHTGEKPYACPHCPYRSIQMTNLEAHIKKSHTSVLIE